MDIKTLLNTKYTKVTKEKPNKASFILCVLRAFCV